MDQELLEPLPKVGRLNTVKSVRRELRTVYRLMRHGKMSANAAGSHAYVLSLIGKLLEVETLEARLAALEGRAGIVEHQVHDARQLISGGSGGIVN